MIQETILGKIRFRNGVGGRLVLQVRVRKHGVKYTHDPYLGEDEINIDEYYWRDATIEDLQLLDIKAQLKE